MSTSPTSDSLSLEMRGIDAIIPYWRNPRRIMDETVNALAASIERYDYNQPIVVDENDVIIIGHTRYAALRRLGVKEVEVQVARGLSAEEAKQLRIVDNKSGEYSRWDHEKLAAEFSDSDAEELLGFFPELAGLVEAGEKVVTDERLAGLDDAVVEYDEEEDDEVEFVCPSCFHGWEMKVTKSMIFSGLIKEKG